MYMSFSCMGDFLTISILFKQALFNCHWSGRENWWAIYSRVQKFKTTYQKFPFLISSIMLSSGLFKIALSYCISRARCFLQYNRVLSACMVKEYLSCFFNIFMVFKSQKMFKKPVCLKLKSLYCNFAQRRVFSKEDLQKSVLKQNGCLSSNC